MREIVPSRIEDEEQQRERDEPNIEDLGRVDEFTFVLRLFLATPNPAVT